MKWYFIVLICISFFTLWTLLSIFLYKQFFKRFYDILLSILALIILAVPLGLVAIMVRIKLGKPIIYNTKRVTRNGRIFNLYKFRSMTNATNEKGELLPDTKRLTKFGRIIRSTSLDELPELINILKGDMSIIGPRPLPPIYLPYYTEQESHRHDIRAGLSGWSQVNGRNSLSWEKKFEYDVEYVKKVSLLFDIKILLLTIKKVFVREGIGQGEEHPGSLNVLRQNQVNFKVEDE